MPKKLAAKFMTVFQAIENDKPGILDIKPLSGRPGYSRLRIGQYRAIYTKDMGIIVIRIGARGGVCK